MSSAICFSIMPSYALGFLPMFTITQFCSKSSGILKIFEILFEMILAGSNFACLLICICACMHKHADTHELGTRRKILGAIRISAQEQNFGSNAVSLLQFGNAISLLQSVNAISAMQFHFCRRQCNSDIHALARP